MKNVELIEQNTSEETNDDLYLVLSAYLVTNDLIFSTSKKGGIRLRRGDRRAVSSLLGCSPRFSFHQKRSLCTLKLELSWTTSPVFTWKS